MASEMETNMFDLAEHAKPNCRLCQIEVTPALDGLTVRIPENQK